MNKPFTPAKRASRSYAIVLAAKKLFLAQGIDPVKMTDIAKECRLGVATLYRYFRVKKGVVIAVGALVWGEAYEDFKAIAEASEREKLNGFESLKRLAGHFYTLFHDNKDFFLFVRDFDSFCIKERVLPSELAENDAIFLKIKDLFMAAGQRGIQDGSVRPHEDFEITYFAFSRALLSLGEKLIGDTAIVQSDKLTDSDKQILALINVLLAYFAH
jgi:AcrR family transcriptional regulator